MKCSPALPFSVSPWHLTRRSLTPGWLAMALLLQFFFMSPALADTAALNRNRGVWDLNGDYSAFWACHPLLGDVGFTAQTTVSTTQPYWRSQNIGTVFAPRTVQLLECPLGFTDTQRLVVLQWAGPNGPPAANGTHNWTLVMDVRFNVVGGWIGLLQTTATTLDGTGVEDGEIFVNPSGALDFVGAGVVGSANGAIAANIWYRLAFRASYNAVTGLQELRAFINGVPAGNTVTTAPNGRFSLSSRIPLFTDNDGETAPLGINSLGFWGEALSDSDLLDIGAFRSTGISWTGLTPTCTLPTLTGKLYFGDFLTTFNPATSPATAPASAASAGLSATDINKGLGLK